MDIEAVNNRLHTEGGLYMGLRLRDKVVVADPGGEIDMTTFKILSTLFRTDDIVAVFEAYEDPYSRGIDTERTIEVRDWTWPDKARVTHVIKKWGRP